MIKTLVTFLFGAAAGAGVSYLYLKPKFEEENAINAEKNRHHYEEKLKEFYAEHPETCNVDDISEPTEEVIEDKKPEGLRKAEELASKLNYNQLYNKEPLGNGGFETKEDNDYTIGHTTNYIEVKVQGKNIENKIEKVKITGREELILIGKIM